MIDLLLDECNLAAGCCAFAVCAPVRGLCSTRVSGLQGVVKIP